MADKMKLTRIRIEQFKQFRQPLEIVGLDAGLNLFTGPNEAGKSTIVEAIRAAFFERHKSSGVEALRPWNDTSASPTVELDFVIGDTRYKLTKSFLSKKRCDLQFGTTSINGTEAEDYLAELLGFQFAARGSSNAQHWGIPGLLWIEQGTAQDVHDQVIYATDHLRSALDESLGAVASAGGDEVIGAVEAARNELLTQSTSKPRGPYAEVLDHVANLSQQIDEIDEKITTYRQKVDSLATLRKAHQTDEATQPWLESKSKQQAAATSLAEIDRTEKSIVTDEQRRAQLVAKINLLRQKLETYVREDEDVVRRRSATESARQQLDAAKSLLETRKTKRQEALANHESARTLLRLARERDNRLRLANESNELLARIGDKTQALKKAEAEQARLVDLRLQTVAFEVPDADLKTLRDQAAQIKEFAIRQNTVATALHYDLEDGKHIGLGSETLTATGDRLLLEPTCLDLPGLGTLRISPGGTDLADLKRKETTLRDKHGALLQRLGAASLDEAERRHTTHRQRLVEIELAETALKLLAANGIDALRADLETERARKNALDDALSRVPATADNAAAALTVDQAEHAEADAATVLQQADKTLSESELSVGTAQASLEMAEQELARAMELASAADRSAQRIQTNHDLTDSLAQESILLSTLATLRAHLASARPEILRQDVERFRLSAEQRERQFNERKLQLHQVETELATLGAQGLEERRSELVRDFAQAERRRDELRRRAAALDHLLALLRDKRQQLIKRIQQPLRERVNHYLTLLFPGATLEVDEHLSPHILCRTVSTGDDLNEYDALSFGAREQIGVISRLAYADLLQAAGRPTLIILDDALVHTDDERLSQMKRILFDASMRHQVLLFTCHPGAWADIGAKVRPLDQLCATTS